MSKHDSKELDYAVTYEQIHTPETGAIGPTFQKESSTIRKGTKMTVCEPWILIEVPNSKDPKKINELLVPISSFKYTRLAKSK